MNRSDALREACSRVMASAAELLVFNEDLSVSDCLQIALIEEEMVHGVPGAPESIGLVNQKKPELPKH